MSKVVRCYGSKRRAIVEREGPKLNPLVSDLVADALEHDESNVRLVKACDLVCAQRARRFHMRVSASVVGYPGSVVPASRVRCRADMELQRLFRAPFRVAVAASASPARCVSARCT